MRVRGTFGSDGESQSLKGAEEVSGKSSYIVVTTPSRIGSYKKCANTPLYDTGKGRRRLQGTLDRGIETGKETTDCERLESGERKRKIQERLVLKMQCIAQLMRSGAAHMPSLKTACPLNSGRKTEYQHAARLILQTAERTLACRVRSAACTRRRRPPRRVQDRD